VGAYVTAARGPLQAVQTLGAMLLRQLGGSGREEAGSGEAGSALARQAPPALDLAAVVVQQGLRLGELTAALADTLPVQSIAVAPPPDPARPRPPPPRALPGRADGPRCDVAAVLRPLLGALSGAAELAGLRLVAHLPADPTELATSAPAPDTRAALSAALEAALHATPSGGALKVVLEDGRGGPLLRCEPGGAGGGAMAGDAGLALAVARLRALGGDGAAVDSGAFELVFPRG